MLCCSERCEKKNQCALYYRNPQPEYRKYDNLEPLDSHGWGSISSEGCEVHTDCGPHGNYAMFSPIPDQMLYKMISNQINSYGFGITVAPENVKSFVEQFRKVDV